MFYGAQVFFLSPAAISNAPEAGISGVNLFFKQKPNANNNISGIAYPGVTVSIVPCINAIPNLTGISTAPSVRVGYVNCLVDPAANIATRFEFTPPVQVPTNTYYAAVVQVEDPGFLLWGVTVGENILGTTTVATGPGGQYVGQFFDAIGKVPSQVGFGYSTNTSMVQTGNSSGNSQFANVVTTTSGWQPVLNFDLKFSVYVARYSFGGNNQLSSFVSNDFPANAQIITTANVTHNSNGETVYTMPALRYDFIAYASGNSSNVGVLVGEKVYQNTVFWPGGKTTPAQVSVTANSNRITAISNTINWSTLLNVGGNDPEYIVVTSGNSLGNNASQVCVRQVTGLISNTVATVDTPFSFTNTAAFFFRSPVGTVDQWMKGKLFGTRQTVMILANVSSNSSMRFVNDSILDCQVNAIGSGYTNTDYFQITGFESVASKVLGGYLANGNINTFSNGSIANVYMANLGCGFVNSSAITVTFYAANGAASNGSGGTLATDIGSTMCAELLGITGTGGYFVQCKVINIEVGNEIPGLGVNNPGGTVYHATEYLPYYSVDDANTVIGKTYYCDPAANADVFAISFGQTVYPWSFTKRRVYPSWSNELVIPYVNGAVSNGSGGYPNGNILPLTSNASILQVNTVSNSDFAAVTLAAGWSTVTFSRWIVNNDYTLENTNQGNAWAKGVEVSFNIANAQLAEDIVVYSTLYRPSICNVVMFARVYNSSDPDQFIDKDWTMLQVNGGNSVFSSPIDPSQLLEITWGFQNYPNNSVLAGTATTTADQSNVVGFGTTWQTNTTINLASGDLVVIYQPLFANLDYQVAVVNAVVNNTLFSIKGTTSNNNILGSGMSVAKITYPKQAFKNAQNENIVRYFNSQQVPFDGYDVCELKVVMLSANGLVVPILQDLRAIAISA